MNKASDRTLSVLGPLSVVRGFIPTDPRVAFTGRNSEPTGRCWWINWPVIVEQGRRDSNSQPLVLETSALPIELHPFARNASARNRIARTCTDCFLPPQREPLAGPVRTIGAMERPGRRFEGISPQGNNNGHREEARVCRSIAEAFRSHLKSAAFDGENLGELLRRYSLAALNRIRRRPAIVFGATPTENTLSSSRAEMSDFLLRE